jgi:hypothetical protein
LLIRGGDLGKNMSAYLAQRIEQTANIEVRRHTEISKMHGGDCLTAVELAMPLDRSRGSASWSRSNDTILCSTACVASSWLTPCLLADRWTSSTVMVIRKMPALGPSGRSLLAASILLTDGLFVI